MSENHYLNLCELDDLAELIEMNSQHVGELGYRLTHEEMPRGERRDLQRRLKQCQRTIDYDKRRMKGLVRSWLHGYRPRTQHHDRTVR